MVKGNFSISYFDDVTGEKQSLLLMILTRVRSHQSFNWRTEPVVSLLKIQPANFLGIYKLLGKSQRISSEFINHREWCLNLPQKFNMIKSVNQKWTKNSKNLKL